MEGYKTVGEVDFGSAKLLAMVNFVGDMFTYSQLRMNEYFCVHMNLMEVVPVYLVMYSIKVMIMMYWPMNWALHKRATNDPCVRNDDLGPSINDVCNFFL